MRLLSVVAFLATLIGPVTLNAARGACETLHAFALENAHALGPAPELTLYYLNK